MIYGEYFPLGIATSNAFVGRKTEVNWLHKNILGKIHTLILGPRRYGKSSLALHTFEQYKLLYVEIDFQLCQSSRSVEEVIISGVENLLTNICSNKEAVIFAAKNFLKNKNKSWTIELIDHIEVHIKPNHHYNIAENILTVLEFLELVLQQEGKDAVIFIDEIQEITHLKESFEIQGALRHFAQKSKFISFVFAGNNLSMLKHMFSKQTMPLYQLCDTINLAPLDKDLYADYLSKLPHIDIDKNTETEMSPKIEAEIINKIIDYTQCHPGRTNHLCLYLWRLAEENKQTISKQDIDTAWRKLVETEGKTVRTFLIQLDKTEMEVLSFLANRTNNNILGLTLDQIQTLSKQPHIELIQVLQKLEEIDLLESSNGINYSIVDPVVKSVLKQYETNHSSASMAEKIF